MLGFRHNTACQASMSSEQHCMQHELWGGSYPGAWITLVRDVTTHHAKLKAYRTVPSTHDSLCRCFTKLEAALVFICSSSRNRSTSPSFSRPPGSTAPTPKTHLMAHSIPRHMQLLRTQVSTDVCAPTHCQMQLISLGTWPVWGVWLWGHTSLASALPVASATLFLLPGPIPQWAGQTWGWSRFGFYLHILDCFNYAHCSLKGLGISVLAITTNHHAGSSSPVKEVREYYSPIRSGVVHFRNRSPPFAISPHTESFRKTPSAKRMSITVSVPPKR